MDLKASPKGSSEHRQGISGASHSATFPTTLAAANGGPLARGFGDPHQLATWDRRTTTPSSASRSVRVLVARTRRTIRLPKRTSGRALRDGPDAVSRSTPQRPTELGLVEPPSCRASRSRRSRPARRTHRQEAAARLRTSKDVMRRRASFRRRVPWKLNSEALRDDRSKCRRLEGRWPSREARAPMAGDSSAPRYRHLMQVIDGALRWRPRPTTTTEMEPWRTAPRARRRTGQSVIDDHVVFPPAWARRGRSATRNGISRYALETVDRQPRFRDR